MAMNIEFIVFACVIVAGIVLLARHLYERFKVARRG
ncbi:hypothetical protein XHC_4462 [Xanthomonas hortorum pv. carotae str. M081]|nr:hypothetical protein XHC_4462 [Xanthomonas hortorum pv. carotae str. M081]